MERIELEEKVHWFFIAMIPPKFLLLKPGGYGHAWRCVDGNRWSFGQPQMVEIYLPLGGNDPFSL